MLPWIKHTTCLYTQYYSILLTIGSEVAGAGPIPLHFDIKPGSRRTLQVTYTCSRCGTLTGGEAKHRGVVSGTGAVRTAAFGALECDACRLCAW